MTGCANASSLAESVVALMINKIGKYKSPCRLIGIMYAGRDENDIRDDIVFYCMNAYWETLIMQLPELPMGMQWKVCVNTFLPYEDGKNVEEQTEFYYKKS